MEKAKLIDPAAMDGAAEGRADLGAKKIIERIEELIAEHPEIAERVAAFAESLVGRSR